MDNKDHSSSTPPFPGSFMFWGSKPEAKALIQVELVWMLVDLWKQKSLAFWAALIWQIYSVQKSTSYI